MFFMSPTFRAPGVLCFVIVVFPGYLHLGVSSKTKQTAKRNCNRNTGLKWSITVNNVIKSYNVFV